MKQCQHTRNLLRNDAAGFTLIEVLVATVIVSIMMGSLYLSFQTGLIAFKRTEDHLMDQREVDIFVMQLSEELRNSMPYQPEPLIGTPLELSFPTRLRRYTSKGFEEEVSLIQYEWKSGQLIRTEQKLVKKSLKERSKTREVLFQNLSDFRFEYLYVTRDDEIKWEDAWKNRPYVGLPRAVRVKLARRGVDKEALVHQILMPQGKLMLTKG